MLPTAHSKLWRNKAILQATATFSMSEADEWQRKLAGLRVSRQRRGQPRGSDAMSAPAETPSTLGRVVVDASVAIKWFVPEIHTDAARRLLREGITLLAPDLIWAEVANALWRKWREQELAAAAVQEILTDFRRFPAAHPRRRIAL